MMNITLIAAGRMKNGPEAQLFQTYEKRLKGKTTLVEVEVKGNLTPVERQKAEAEKINKALPANTIIIALDAGGETFTSEGLAKKIQNFQTGGNSHMTLIIGGADGLSHDILERADLVLSLGSMTWPHLMVRAMLAEQLYRAQTILTGHPYHH